MDKDNRDKTGGQTGQDQKSLEQEATGLTSFPKRFDELLDKTGHKVSSFANACAQHSETDVRNIEKNFFRIRNGKTLHPRLDTLKLIAKGFGITLQELVDGTVLEPKYLHLFKSAEGVGIR